MKCATGCGKSATVEEPDGTRVCGLCFEARGGLQAHPALAALGELWDVLLGKLAEVQA